VRHLLTFHLCYKDRNDLEIFLCIRSFSGVVIHISFNHDTKLVLENLDLQLDTVTINTIASRINCDYYLFSGHVVA
jgi:hypothetical protein